MARPPDLLANSRASVMADASRDAMFLLSADLAILEVNAAAIEMYGYTREELLRLSPAELRIENARVHVRQQLAQADAAGALYETVHQRKDGTTFPVEISSQGVTIAGERFLVSVVRDVSARKEQEAELERRAAFDEMLARFLGRLTTCRDDDLDTLVTEALGAVAGSMGADHAFIVHIGGDDTFSVTHEWCGADVPSRRHELQRIPVARAWNASQLLAGEMVVLDNVLNVPPDDPGEADWRAWLAHEGARSVLTTPTSDATGQVTGVLGFHRHASASPWRAHDIAGVRLLGNSLTGALERRRADQARRESEARYRLLAENTTDNIWLYDLASDRFAYVSPSVVRQRGFTAEEVIATPFAAHLAAGEADAVRRALAARVQAFEAGDESARDVTYNVGLRRKDGSVMPAEISTSLLTGPEGTVTGLQGVTRDVTERQALEAQLLQSQKMEAVGRLAGGIAHDFNNMLSVIIGHAELGLLRLEPDDPARTDLEEIIAAGQRSADLTGQLLAFARKQTIRPLTIDLNDTLVGMLKMLQRVIGEDVELQWRPAARVWPVRLDPGQLDQVLVNLAVNARDAMPGAGRLTIETANVSIGGGQESPRDLPPGDYVLLSVADTGTGMSAEVLANAFEPFFTTKETGKGTGLGLSTVYGIVKQHGGYVALESEPGRGTTVRIYFPRVEAAAASAGEAAEQPRPLGGSETILLVEDAPGVRSMATRMLGLLGYQVLAAEDPSEALDVARATTGGIHLLLTDVILPEMNGLDLSRRIEVEQPGIRRVFMSGYTADVMARQGVLEEALRFLKKPFTFAELANAVRDALDAPTAYLPSALGISGDAKSGSGSPKM